MVITNLFTSKSTHIKTPHFQLTAHMRFYAKFFWLCLRIVEKLALYLHQISTILSFELTFSDT